MTYIRRFSGITADKFVYILGPKGDPGPQGPQGIPGTSGSSLVFTDLQEDPYNASFGEFVVTTGASVTLPASSGQVDGMVGIVTLSGSTTVITDGGDTILANITPSPPVLLENSGSSLVLQSVGNGFWVVVSYFDGNIPGQGA